MKRDPVPYAPGWQTPSGIRRVVIEVAADRYTPLDCINLVVAWLANDDLSFEAYRAWVQQNSGYPFDHYPEEELRRQLLAIAAFTSQVDTFPGHFLYVPLAEGMVN